MKNILILIATAFIASTLTYYLKPEPLPDIITLKIKTRLSAKKLTHILPTKSTPEMFIWDDLNYSQDVEKIKETKSTNNILGLSLTSISYAKSLYILSIKTPLYIGFRYNYIEQHGELALFYIF